MFICARVCASTLYECWDTMICLCARRRCRWHSNGSVSVWRIRSQCDEHTAVSVTARHCHHRRRPARTRTSTGVHRRNRECWCYTSRRSRSRVNWSLHDKTLINPLTPLLPIWIQLYQTRLSRASRVLDVKNYKWQLNPVWHRMLCSCTHMATVGVKGLMNEASHEPLASVDWS